MPIDYVMELLRDGKWHYVRTLARRLDQPEDNIRKILTFFADFDIATFNKSGNKVKIDEKFGKLFE